MTSIRIDQALFGYREGHRLLQASRKFAPTTERSLLTLTDMSGSRMLGGFEEYLSGYPVPGERSYAFVKTWYAPEMERPGCVWSHALVIRNLDWGGLNDLDDLLPLFRRPEGPELDAYAAPAIVHAPNGSTAQLLKASKTDVAALLVALYGRPEKPVVIAASDARTYERLVLSIWAQQWPALRGAFRFCTGSLSARTFGGRSFDLQVVPHSLLRELQRDPSAFAWPLPSEHDGSLSDPSNWVRVGSVDLIESQGMFRQFLWKYADSEGEGRSFYSKAGDLFAFFERSSLNSDLSHLAEITRRVVGAFPEPTRGVAIKDGLYGPAIHPLPHLPFIDEEARLIELAKTPFWDSFDPVKLRLRERAGKYWKSLPSHGKALLLDLLGGTYDPLAEEIVGGFAENISVPEACEIARERPGVLLALIARNPFLVASEQFWHCKLPQHIHYGILDVLKADKTSGISTASWVPYLVDSRADDLASAVVERFASETLHVFLDRALNNGNQETWIPNASWRSALSARQVELQASLLRRDVTASDCAMTLLAGLLDAHRQELLAYGFRPWLELVRSGLGFVFQFPNAEAAGFLLSLGFQYSDKEALELIAPCFEHVHAAARDDSPEGLGYRTWKSLEFEVPTLSWAKNWDKCERLRRGLVERFIRNSWPKEEFLRCISRPATLHSVLYSCRSIRGGEEFICLVAEAVLDGNLNATAPQVEVLNRSFRRNWRGELRLDL